MLYALWTLEILFCHTLFLDSSLKSTTSLQLLKLLRYLDHSRSDWCEVAINAGEGVEKREPSYTLGGNAN